MKLSFTFFILLFVTCTFAQSKYVPDVYITVDGKPGNYKIINYDNEKVLCSNLKVDEFISGANHGLMVARIGKNIALMNIYGKIVSPLFEYINSEDHSSNGIEPLDNYFIVRQGNKIGMLDTTGKIALPLGEYYDIWDATNGLVGAEIDGKQGLFRKGKMVLPIEYNSPIAYQLHFEESESALIISKNDKYGILNSKGIITHDTKYAEYQINNDYFSLKNEEHTVLVNRYTGAEIGKFPPTTFNNIVDSIIYAYTPTSYGLFNLKGETICPFEFSEIGNLYKQEAVFVKKDGLWGIYNLRSQQPVNCEFEIQPTWNDNGKAVVFKKGFYGLVDTRSNYVVPANYESYSLSTSYSPYSFARKNGKYGIFTSEGKVKLDCIYDTIYNSYGNGIIKLNGKSGLHSKTFDIIIPCEYDDLFYTVNDLHYIVVKNKQYGVFDDNGKMIIPCIYDSIYVTNNTAGQRYFATIRDKKIGIRDDKGVEIFAPGVDEIVVFDLNHILTKVDGRLVLYANRPNLMLAIEPEETVAFDKYSFVKVKDLWFCTDNATQRVVGEPYAELGKFDKRGHAIARVRDKDHFIAIDQNGFNTKPKFHLVTETVFDAAVPNLESSTIANEFLKRGLISRDITIAIDDAINHDYKIETSEYYYINEYGEETDSIFYTMSVYKKSSYLDLGGEFPTEPKFEFNYGDYYAAWGPANAQGWRYAKTEHPDWENARLTINEHTLLVNEIGETIQKENYIIEQSDPFYSYDFNSQYDYSYDYPQAIMEMYEQQPWDSLVKYPKVIDSIQHYFKSARTLSPLEFVRSYKDSLYIFVTTNYSYSEVENTIYRYQFYKTKDIQLFELPPPVDVKFRFVMDKPNKIKGAEHIFDEVTTVDISMNHELPGPVYQDFYLQMSHLVQFSVNNKTAYAFGRYKSFIYPNHSEFDSDSVKAEQLKKLKTNPEFAVVKYDLDNYDKYTKLIKSGYTYPYLYDSRDSLKTKLQENHYNEITLLSHVSNMGLVIENELYLEPVYYDIVQCNIPNGKKGNFDFIVIDSNLNVWKYDIETRKLVADRSTNLIAKNRNGIFTQNKETRLYDFYNQGFIGLKYDRIQPNVFSFPNISNMEYMVFLSNCQHDIPLANIWGEDSIVTLEDGTMMFVYPSYCDTNVMGKHGTFTPEKDFSGYKLAGETMGRKVWMPDSTFRVTPTAIRFSLGIHFDFMDGVEVIDQNEGILIRKNGITLKLSEKDYQLSKYAIYGKQGYGGVFSKGKFIPYQTLKPFPEKFKMISAIRENGYLAGDEKSVQIVRLNNDNTLTKSSFTFKSFQDYFESADYDLKLKIEEFLGAEQ